MLILFLAVRHKRIGDSAKGGLLDDIDDERATVMVYSTEGGGEEDQVSEGYLVLMIIY